MRRIFFYVIILLLSVNSACSSREEATFQGKVTSEWISQLSDMDPRTRLKAVEALGHIGADTKDVVPALADMLLDDHREIRDAAEEALSHIGLVVIPELVKNIEDENGDIREHVYSAIVNVGEDWYRNSMSLSRTSERELNEPAGQKQMLSLLKMIEQELPLMKEAYGAMVIGMDNDNPGVVDYKITAMDGIWETVDRIHRDLGELIGKLEGKNEEIVVVSKVLLAEIENSWKNTIPEIAKMIEGRGRGRNFGKLFDGSAIPIFKDLLDDKDQKVRTGAAIALAISGKEEAALAVPVLTGLLESDKHKFRAALYLIRIDPNLGQKTVPALVEALENSDSQVRYDALEAMNEIVRKTKIPPEAIIRRLDDETMLVRRMACIVLSKIGGEAKAALPTLKRLSAGDPSQDVRNAAGIAIDMIGSD